MLDHDPTTRNEFKSLRKYVTVLSISIVLIWITFISWVLWRLGPGGYTPSDAQADRERLCIALNEVFPKANLKCPEITGTVD